MQYGPEQFISFLTLFVTSSVILFKTELLTIIYEMKQQMNKWDEMKLNFNPEAWLVCLCFQSTNKLIKQQKPFVLFLFFFSYKKAVKFCDCNTLHKPY